MGVNVRWVGRIETAGIHEEEGEIAIGE